MKCEKLFKTVVLFGKVGHMFVLYPVHNLRAIPENIPGRGRRQVIYFSMGGWC